MARLIDANALMEEINTQRRASMGSYPRRYYVVGDVLNSIRNAPTVDAVEVVHGRWIGEVGGYMWRQNCSVCNNPVYNKMKPYYSYCPNCGAKMDK